ncbi:MAG: MCE family protein, partial [Solirubrobacterales bacterium]|nr:MCE family protein [Solirubrobacterales bacterium]
MNRAVIIGLMVAVLAAVLHLRGGDSGYRVNLRMANAAGLSDGSPVVIGGVDVGKVKLHARQDRVDVEAQIDADHAPLDKRTRAVVISRNALGQKLLSLQVPVGGITEPAPDGYLLPDGRASAAADLDQVLSALDPDTRARLAIVLNEMGIAVSGRKLDFQTLTQELAPALASGSDLLSQLTEDNRALGNAVVKSNRFIGKLADDRRRVTDMFDETGKATEAVAARQAQLRATLQAAPAMLRSARSFLAELQDTTRPLAATARQLRAAAPSLATTLDRIDPLRKAAVPTLDAAEAVAPALQRTAEKTLPALREAVPALSSVQSALQTEAPPVEDALSNSVDNVTAVLENWSRAIQFRDGLGHVFRGEASVAPSLYERLLASTGATIPPARSARKGSRKPNPAATPESTDGEPGSAPQKTPPVAVPPKAGQLLDKVLPGQAGVTAQQALDSVLGGLGGARAPAPAPAPAP